MNDALGVGFMAGGLVLVAGVTLTIVVLGVFAARGWRARTGLPAGRLRSVRVRASAVSSVVLLASLGGWVWLATSGRISPSLLAATAPASIATLLVLAITLGELTWPDPDGAIRVAALAGVRPEPSRWLTRTTWASVALGAALLLVGTLTAAPDGRSLSVTWPSGTAASGPYPGVAYSLPVAVALLLLAGTTSAGVGVTQQRPVLDVTRADADAWARVTSTGWILRASAAGALLTVAGLSLAMGRALRSLAQSVRMNAGSAAPTGWDWWDAGGLALIGLGCAALLASVVCILVRPRHPRPAAAALPQPRSGAAR